MLHTILPIFEKLEESKDAEGFIKALINVTDPGYRDYILTRSIKNERFIESICDYIIQDKSQYHTLIPYFLKIIDKLSSVNEQLATDLVKRLEYANPSFSDIITKIDPQFANYFDFTLSDCVFYDKELARNPRLNPGALQITNLTPDNIPSLVILMNCVQNNKKFQHVVFDYDFQNPEVNAVIFGALRTDTSIGVLDVQNTGFGDEQAKTLAEILKTNSSLGHLNLSNTQITNNGARMLADAFRTNIYVSCLNLNDCTHVSKNGIDTLASAVLSNNKRTRVFSLAGQDDSQSKAFLKRATENCDRIEAYQNHTKRMKGNDANSSFARMVDLSVTSSRSVM